MRLMLLTLLFVLGFVTSIHIPSLHRGAFFVNGQIVYYEILVISSGQDTVVR